MEDWARWQLWKEFAGYIICGALLVLCVLVWLADMIVQAVKKRKKEKRKK